MIDDTKWEEVEHNPVRLLPEIHQDRWGQLLRDPVFMNHYSHVMQSWDDYMLAPTWFQKQYPKFKGQFAYFSAEFGFHESLPIYSGGLGILAGDHCKSASDLGVPLVGVGLLYKKGYFQQKIDHEGKQRAEFVDYRFDQLPIVPVYVDGEELTIEIPMRGRHVQLKVWQVNVGRMTVYLLDSNLEGNSDFDRQLTASLYGGNHETRIQQEILLGIGGIRMLRSLQISPSAYHINEGHAAFISLERLREYIHQGIRYATAIELIRASTIFTTHTPVPAGHDVFPMNLFEYHLSPLLQAIEYEKPLIVQLGNDRSKNGFNMTYLALNTSVYRNGVSKLHGKVSREMFRAFHGDIPVDEVPIDSITNGVHLDTWMAPEMKALLDQFMPQVWVENQTEASQWEAVSLIPNKVLWGMHNQLKLRLIDHTRANLATQRRRNEESEGRIAEIHGFLNSQALTIGFARRFATYKRSTMLFNDLARLDKLINDPSRPLQFIFAGKSHPADHPGQDLIREVYRVSQLDAFKGKIIIVENYDINLARYLVQGVDVWLNNPRRPLEASGTSGMKAALNGVINFSVLDGWWEEGYDGNNGWEITSNYEAPWEVQERENTNSLYETLEKEIAPLFYERSEGLPLGWIARMKHCIQSLAPQYNTDRMVKEYTNKFYIQTSERFSRFNGNENENAMRFADFKSYLVEHWYMVRILHVRDQAEPEKQGFKEIEVRVALGSIHIRSVTVEAIYYTENNNQWLPTSVTLAYHLQIHNGEYLYRGVIPEHLIHGPHFLVRVRPRHNEFVATFELPLVTST